LQTWDYNYNSGGWDDYPPQLALHKDPDLRRFIAPCVTTSYAIRFAQHMSAFAMGIGMCEDVSVNASDLTRWVQGTATEVAASSEYLGAVSSGAGNVGFGDGWQWRNLVIIAVDAADVARIESAWKVELELDLGYVNGQPDAPDWEVEFLGQVDTLGSVSEAAWNRSLYEAVIGESGWVGTLATGGLMVDQRWEVTGVMDGLVEPTATDYLVFRVSSLPPPGMASGYNGGLATDLTGQGLYLYHDDSVVGIVTAEDRITVAEGGTQQLAVRLAGQPSGPVQVNAVLAAGDWLQVEPESLLFDGSNWEQVQWLTLNGNGDGAYAYMSERLHLVVDALVRPSAWSGIAKAIWVERVDNDPLNIGVLEGVETWTAVKEMETEAASQSVVSAAHYSPVWTHDGSIYHVYVNHLQEAIVAKLDPHGVRTTHVLKTGVIADAHHSFSIGVDPQGYLHVTGDMHNGRYVDGVQEDAWNYWVSTQPGDISSWEYYPGSAWDNWPDAVGTDETGPALSGNMASYAVFRPDNGGRLFMSFRGRARKDFGLNGGKGWTGLRLQRLDGSGARRWTALGDFALPVHDADFFPAKVIGWDVAGGRIQKDESGTVISDWYQTYRGQYWFDASNRLHLAWSYFGENSQTADVSVPTDIGSGATHILYACSPDGGVTWQRADGSAIELPLSPANADIVVERAPGDLTSTCYIVTTAEGYPVVSYSRRGIPMHGDPYLKSWTPQAGWGAEVALPTADAFQLLADRRGILTLPDNTGTWYRSYDNGLSWTSYTGMPEYSGGSSGAVDYVHLIETGEIRFHRFVEVGSIWRYEVWTVAFAPTMTPSLAETWRSTWFGSPAEAGHAEELADPDEDGISNLLERALGLNPLLAEGEQTLLSFADAAGSMTADFNFSRRTGGSTDANGIYRHAELAYWIEISHDMLQWNRVAQPIVLDQGAAIESGYEQVLVQLTETLDANAPVFVRLKVEIQP
jgi:hypothetical protein